MKKEVTERDLRDPKFLQGDPSEYEFRDDGSIARKDRWETGIRNIASAVGIGNGIADALGVRAWEIDDVVKKVREYRDTVDKVKGLREIYEQTTPGEWMLFASNAIGTDDGRNVSTIHSGLSCQDAELIVRMKDALDVLFGDKE